MNPSDIIHAARALLLATPPDLAEIERQLAAAEAMMRRLERTLDEITAEAMEDELLRVHAVRDVGGNVVVLRRH